ncbi:MAG: sigma-70 family RNA polymerase sigma factor [Verrucomicrobiae bacterium]|nr:sigma-70 family RNA polymerase sigma factor [Verrucomicrobiae bacterium]
MFAIHLHDLTRKEQYAFDNFITSYAKTTFSFVYGIVQNTGDAEDVAQRVYLKLFTMESSRFPSRGEKS